MVAKSRHSILVRDGEGVNFARSFGDEMFDITGKAACAKAPGPMLDGPAISTPLQNNFLAPTTLPEGSRLPVGGGGSVLNA